MKEQPNRKSRCPKCGGAPTDESAKRHHLSDLGYLHDDQLFECSECGEEYPHGVPIGEFDGDAEDLWCDVCELGFMNVHRVRVRSDEQVGLDLKCPHHHHFDCPECDEVVPADGIDRRKDGSLGCPYCYEDVAREDVPFCFYFDQTTRDFGERDIALIGFPSITGQMQGADPYGYTDDPDESGEVLTDSE